MDVREKNRHEIEARLSTMGDYVKMEYLNDCLKKITDFETRRFVMIRLADIYEAKKMFLEAGKLFRKIAEINTSTSNKISDFTKSGGLLPVVSTTWYFTSPGKRIRLKAWAPFSVLPSALKASPEL